MTNILRPRRVADSRRIALTINDTTTELTPTDARRLATQLRSALAASHDAQSLGEALTRIASQPTAALKRRERDAAAWDLYHRRGWHFVDIGALFAITGHAAADGIDRHHRRLRTCGTVDDW